MTTTRFSKREAIRFGWETMKRHKGFFILMYLVYGLILYVPATLIRMAPRPAMHQTALLILFQLGINLCLTIIVFTATLGFAQVALKLCDNAQVRVGDLFSASGTQVFYYFVASLLAGMLVGVGYLPMIMLIFDLVLRFTEFPLFREYLMWLDVLTVITLPLAVLGIIWAIRLSKFPYFIVDGRANPIDALKGSWALTKGSTWNLLLFTFLLGLINMLGALAFGIGLLATIPTAQVAHAFVYRKLRSNHVPLTPAPA